MTLLTSRGCCKDSVSGGMGHVPVTHSALSPTRTVCLGCTLELPEKLERGRNGLTGRPDLIAQVCRQGRKPSLLGFLKNYPGDSNVYRPEHIKPGLTPRSPSPAKLPTHQGHRRPWIGTSTQRCQDVSRTGPCSSGKKAEAETQL